MLQFVKVVFGPVTQVELSKRGVPPRMPNCACEREMIARSCREYSMNIVAVDYSICGLVRCREDKQQSFLKHDEETEKAIARAEWRLGGDTLRSRNLLSLVHDSRACISPRCSHQINRM